MKATVLGGAVPWRVHALADLHWRRWDQEWVVFDVGSGQTHQMDTLTAATLMLLEAGSATSAQLVARLAEELFLDGDAPLSSTLTDILGRLSAAGLIEASSSHDPVVGAVRH